MEMIKINNTKQEAEKIFVDVQANLAQWEKLFCNKCMAYVNNESEDIAEAKATGMIAFIKRINTFKKNFMKNICPHCRQRIMQKWQEQNKCNK